MGGKIAPERMLTITLLCAQDTEAELGQAQDGSSLLRKAILTSSQGGSCSSPNNKTESAKHEVQYDFSGRLCGEWFHSATQVLAFHLHAST